MTEDNEGQMSSRASSPGRHERFNSSKNPDDSDNNNDNDNNDNTQDTMPRSSKPKSRNRSQGGSTVGAGAAVSAVGKIRHLKKDDGEPLWRKDIQYDFLKAVFDDERKEFTNSYDQNQTEKQNFADLYIDTMARSSKTSKVLRDKLLSDREAAKSMAMVCLLVNVGRMNTTLNCAFPLLPLLSIIYTRAIANRCNTVFPEMRAQLRTYHAIPSLQAYQDASAYKQLQDAPRLKSILKGAAEDRVEPDSLNSFKGAPVPRTNPVNLIFLICQQASHVRELHFPQGGEFHDLVMKTNCTSQSRANAFLWLMWFYLESDFTEEGCDENPFGAGVDYGEGVANQGVPQMTEMTPEEEALENIDPKEELDFGLEKQAFRAKIIAADAAYAQDHQPKVKAPKGKLLGEEGPSAAILPRIRPSKHESDLDSTRSTPPPRALGGRLGASSTGGARRGGSLKYQVFEASSPAAPALSIDGVVPRKPRPPTAHQLAVERNRNQRVEYILDRGLRKEHHSARKARRQEGSILRVKRRLDEMADPFVDSDNDDYRYGMDKNSAPFLSKGVGGLCQLTGEKEDFGEEFASYAASLRRVNRRLERWDAHRGDDLGVVGTNRKHTQRQVSFDDSPEPESPEPTRSRDEMSAEVYDRRARTNGDTNGDANDDVDMEDAGDLDNLDKELLGMASGGEDSKDEDEELDDVERDLLGMGD
jgi:Ino eighty subunit 1